MKKALVIGSEGNIGKPLVAYLKKKGYQVKESDIKPGWRKNYHMADINHAIDLLPVFDWKPNVVFILSAMVSRVTCEQAGSLAIATNLGGIHNVLELCKRANAMTVFFSTSEVYGPTCAVMDESISNPRPNNRYGLSKLLGEQLVEYEVRTHGLKAVTIRPFMMYDENEAFGEHRSAMIRFACNLVRGIPIEVHKGSARGWLHVSDAVKAIEAAVRVQKYTVINIGHPNVVSMDHLAKLMCKTLGVSNSLIHYTDLPARMTLVKKPVLKRQKELLNVVPKVSLEEGVSKVCQKVAERLTFEKKRSI
ncbi:MAG TPA: NAD(P)-dependent oxidoreductase [Candidatus Omnitrophota bacterium]|nr:NAD(P)-dependent oxidoreductase [Candidatus Omnitrophota bacterium]